MRRLCWPHRSPPQCFQAVAGRNQEIGEHLGAIECRQPPQRDRLDALEFLDSLTIPQPLGFLALKTPDHRIRLTRYTLYVKRIIGQDRDWSVFPLGVQLGKRHPHLVRQCLCVLDLDQRALADPRAILSRLRPLARAVHQLGPRMGKSDTVSASPGESRSPPRAESGSAIHAARGAAYGLGSGKHICARIGPRSSRRSWRRAPDLPPTGRRTPAAGSTRYTLAGIQT